MQNNPVIDGGVEEETVKVYKSRFDPDTKFESKAEADAHHEKAAFRVAVQLAFDENVRYLSDGLTRLEKVKSDVARFMPAFHAMEEAGLINFNGSTSLEVYIQELDAKAEKQLEIDEVNEEEETDDEAA